MEKVELDEESPSRSHATSPEENGTKKNTKLWQNLGIVLLCVLIFGVWSLASVPIIVYQFPISVSGVRIKFNYNITPGYSTYLQENLFSYFVQSVAWANANRSQINRFLLVLAIIFSFFFF